MAEIKILPLSNNVVVKPIEPKEVRKGGIIIPDTAKDKPQEGEIIAVGPGKMTDEGKRLPMELKVNDRVLYGEYSGHRVKVEDVEYLIIAEHEILGILK